MRTREKDLQKYKIKHNRCKHFLLINQNKLNKKYALHFEYGINKTKASKIFNIAVKMHIYTFIPRRDDVPHGFYDCDENKNLVQFSRIDNCLYLLTKWHFIKVINPTVIFQSYIHKYILIHIACEFIQNVFFFSKDVNFEYMKSEMGLLNNQIKYKLNAHQFLMIGSNTNHCHSNYEKTVLNLVGLFFVRNFLKNHLQSNYEDIISMGYIPSFVFSRSLTLLIISNN